MFALVVEDDEIAAHDARRILEGLGYRVDIAANGAEALSRCHSADYSLILMDWHMPVMNGREATERIRRLPTAGMPPLIIGTAPEIGLTRCLLAGMDDLIPGPIAVQTVKSVINRWI